MKKYRGFYIDGLHFKSDADIDAHIKNMAIHQFKLTVQCFYKNPIMEYSVAVDKHAQRLVEQFGMTPSEVEQMEISCYE